MNSIINPVERIRLVPNAFVDINFRQNRDGFRKQLAKRNGVDNVSEKEVESTIQDFQKSIEELIEKVSPYQLPKDYLFFLEDYGGIEIWNEDEYRFEIQGIGPMVLDRYGDFICDNWGERSDPLLPGPRGFIIADLRLDLELAKAKSLGVATKTWINHDGIEFEYVPSKRIQFRLDIAGTVKQDSIIGIGPDKTGSVHPLSLGDGDMRRWQKLADSFSEWLELVADTQGLLGYVY